MLDKGFIISLNLTELLLVRMAFEFVWGTYKNYSRMIIGFYCRAISTELAVVLRGCCYTASIRSKHSLFVFLHF